MLTFIYSETKMYKYKKCIKYNNKYFKIRLTYFTAPSMEREIFWGSLKTNFEKLITIYIKITNT